jgi:hypothetical protein
LPFLAGVAVGPVRSEKLRLSGQMPPSTMPMITPSPLVWDQAPPGAVRPRKSGVEEVSRLRELVLGDSQHALGLCELRGLLGGEFSREAVEHVAVAVELLAAADLREHLVLTCDSRKAM